MFSTLDIRVSQFVYKHNLGLPLQDCVQVHLIESSASVLDLPPRDCFHLRRQFSNSSPPVGLHNSDDHVFAAAMTPDSLAQHVERFSNAGRVAQEELENRLLLAWRGFVQPLFGCLGHAYVLSS